MRRRRPNPVMLLALLTWTGWCGLALADADEQGVAAWKQWKSIQAAIALRALDGPEDIIEKAEIIEDRIDLLNREKTKLDKEIETNRQKMVNLRNQRDVLRDLSELQQGGDYRTRQRLHEITEQIQQEEHTVALRKKSGDALNKELKRLKELLIYYKKKARLLQLQESNEL